MAMQMPTKTIHDADIDSIGKSGVYVPNHHMIASTNDS